MARFNVGYDADGMVKHVGLMPGGVVLTIDGRALWTVLDQPDPNPILLALDPQPVEYVGFWFFLALGVTTTGYHDDDSAKRAVTVFPRGSADALLARADRADTTKYRSAAS